MASLVTTHSTNVLWPHRIRPAPQSPLNTHCGGDRMDGHRGNRQNGPFCCRPCPRPNPSKGESPTYVAPSLSLSPFHRREEKRSEMEWYCCKWPLPLLFCCNNDNFIAFQPRTRTLPSLPTKVRPSELSLFISLSTELWMLFLGAKILFRFSLPCSMGKQWPTSALTEIAS